MKLLALTEDTSLMLALSMAGAWDVVSANELEAPPPGAGLVIVDLGSTEIAIDVALALRGGGVVLPILVLGDEKPSADADVVFLRRPFSLPELLRAVETGLHGNGGAEVTATSVQETGVAPGRRDEATQPPASPGDRPGRSGLRRRRQRDEPKAPASPSSGTPEPTPPAPRVGPASPPQLPQRPPLSKRNPAPIAESPPSRPASAPSRPASAPAAEKAVPAQSLRPAEPVAPAEPVRAAEPVRRTEPSLPTQPPRPAEPTRSTEPSGPSRPSAPASPWKTAPVSPAQPVQAAEPPRRPQPRPAQPAGPPPIAATPWRTPAPRPAEPVAPAEPVRAAEPPRPVEPVHVSEPAAESVRPSAPVRPYEPAPAEPPRAQNPAAPARGEEPPLPPAFYPVLRKAQPAPPASPAPPVQHDAPRRPAAPVREAAAAPIPDFVSLVPNANLDITPEKQPRRFRPSKDRHASPADAVATPAEKATPKPLPTPMASTGATSRRRAAWFRPRPPDDETPPLEAHPIVRRALDALSSEAVLLSLVDEYPFLAEEGAVHRALLEEIVQTLDPQLAVVLVMSADARFRVAAQAGLTKAETAMKPDAAHPLIHEVFSTRRAVLIKPVDMAQGLVAGLPGARTEALMVSPVVEPDGTCAALVLAGAADYVQRDLDRLWGAASEAAPGFAVARAFERWSASTQPVR